MTLIFNFAFWSCHLIGFLFWGPASHGCIVPSCLLQRQLSPSTCEESVGLGWSWNPALVPGWGIDKRCGPLECPRSPRSCLCHELQFDRLVMCTFYQLAGCLEGTPPPWPFLVSRPHLLMLKAGAFHRLLNHQPPLLSPRGISSAAWWFWYWWLGSLTSISPALSLAYCLGSMSASTSPHSRQVQPDTVILHTETILLYFANLNDHKDQFLGKRRRLAALVFFCNVSIAFAWHCVF